MRFVFCLFIFSLSCDANLLNLEKVQDFSGSVEKQPENLQAEVATAKQKTLLNFNTSSNGDFPLKLPLTIEIGGSVGEVVAMVNWLSGNFDVTIDNSEGEVMRKFNSVQLNLVLRRKSVRNSDEIIQAKRPIWTKRHNVCDYELTRYNRIPLKLIEQLQPFVKCWQNKNQFVCLKRYGIGNYIPTSRIIWRCCKNFVLDKIKAYCVPVNKSVEKRRANSAVSRPIKVFRLHERALIKRRNKHKRGKKNHYRRRRKNRKRRRNNRRRHKKTSKKKIKLDKNKRKSKASIAKKVFTSFRAEHTTENAEYLKNIAGNSIIENKIVDFGSFKNNQLFKAKSGMPIRLNNFGYGIWTANCQKITKPDFWKSENAVVHKISGILSNVQTSTTSYLEKRRSSFSNFYKALSYVGGDSFKSLQSEDKSMTLFVPTNSAFSKSVDEEPIECLNEIVKSHIVEGIFCSINAGKTLTSINGFQIVTHKNNFTIQIHQAKLINRDVMTTNGVVHTVNNLIKKVRTVADILREEKKFKYFYDYYKESGKLEALNKMRNITLFAPMNSAFEGLKGLDAFEIINSPQFLRHQLDYHVTTHITSSSKEPMRILSTRKGTKPVYETTYYDFSEKKKAVSVQCTRLKQQLVARQPGNNRMTSCAGNIVAVEQLFKVPKQNLLEVLKDSKDGDFSMLLQVISRHNLEYLLLKDEPFTFLAPTNNQFKQLSNFVWNKHFANPECARRIITYHILPGYHCFDELMQRPQKIKTVNGQYLYLCPKRGYAMFGKRRNVLRSKTVNTDLIADNGVVHSVDNILIPKYYDVTQYPDDSIL